jgi:RimJ/RimL family protein N-acetyltransferase
MQSVTRFEVQTALGALLEWDSEFWGVRVARVDGSGPGADEWARANDVDVAYLLIGGSDSAAAQEAEERGFRIMDVRVSLEAPSVRSEQPVRTHREADVDTLRAIARKSHEDTRFYADPRFPREHCDELYDTWIRRSCEGWADAVLVVDREGAPAGYVALHRRDGGGSIGLIGVDAPARGQGVGEALVRGALDWCARERLERCSVVTQGRNIVAQRLFQRCGFRVSAVDLWFHKWWS